MNTIAEEYVKLVLAVGEHDEDYVDAYHGPSEWLDEAKKNKSSLAEIYPALVRLQEKLEHLTNTQSTEIEQLRFNNLEKQLSSLQSRVEALQGKKFSFDEESQAYYDAVAPHYPAEHFQNILDEMDKFLPGSGNISKRYDTFRNQFVISQQKLNSVFQAAIDECRKRTKAHIALPENESFKVEYVNRKPWSGYNWFKGNSYSLIQVNTDLPIFIDRAVDLAAHEGYPGHHVYNTLLEQHLFKNLGWVEFSVFPLFSPQALIAEGTANFGVEIVFTRNERITFERDVLFPEAGLDPSTVEQYYLLYDLLQQLTYAGNEAARGYLDGKMPASEAIEWLIMYGLFSKERAEQRIRFFEKYRSYVINYNLGQDLVKSYLEKKGGTPDNPEKRWKEFEKLLSTPRLPSGLL